MTRVSVLLLKVFVILFGVVSVAVGIRFSTPLLDQLPLFWSIIQSWTKPPYLYFIVNGIIITIAASSRYQQAKSSPSIPPEPLVSVKTPPPSDFPSFPDEMEINASVEYKSENRISEVKAVLINGVKVDIDRAEEEFDADDELDGEDKYVVSSYAHTPSQKIISPEVSQQDILPPSTKKPLAPSTIRHRKSRSAIPKGTETLEMTKPKGEKGPETMENTWKMITERSHMPITRHLKKSDTWNHQRHIVTVTPPNHVAKSKTFKDRGDELSFESPLKLPPRATISKEASPSQDELNCRIEEFIKKINEEMRLQRQESLNQYMEMINRAA